MTNQLLNIDSFSFHVLLCFYFHTDMETGTPNEKGWCICSHTLKGKNNKSLRAQGAANVTIKEADRNAPSETTTLLISQLQLKVNIGIITKKQLRNKIKVLTERLDCAHAELIMLLNECDNKDTMLWEIMSKRDKDHAIAVKKLKEVHHAELTQKDSEHLAELMELKEQHCVDIEKKEENMYFYLFVVITGHKYYNYVQTDFGGKVC